MTFEQTMGARQVRTTLVTPVTSTDVDPMSPCFRPSRRAQAADTVH